MKLKKLWAIPASAAGLLATQLSPAQAATSEYGDVHAGYSLGKTALSHHCTSGPWVKRTTGAGSEPYYMAVPRHCVTSPGAAPSSITPTAARQDSWNTGAKATWPNNAGDIVTIPGPYPNSSWSNTELDMALIGPFSSTSASHKVVDHRVSPNTMGAGPLGGGNMSQDNSVSLRRDVMGYSWSTTDELLYTDAEYCFSGYVGGTNCGAVVAYDEHASVGSYTDMPIYTLLLNEFGTCGITEGDSGAPVFIDDWPGSTPAKAPIVGMVIGASGGGPSDNADCFEEPTEEIEVSNTVLFVPMWSIIEQFGNLANWDVIPVNYTMGL